MLSMGDVKVQQAQNDTKNQQWEHSEASVRRTKSVCPHKDCSQQCHSQ